MSKILVVIDMQKNFLKADGAEKIVPFVVEKIKRRREDGYKILFTSDICGGEFDDNVAAASAGCKVYKKSSYGCKQLITDLEALNPRTIEFTGVSTDICLITNVLASMTFLPDSEIVVDENCCASTPQGQSAALAVMKACNVNVIQAKEQNKSC